MKLAWATDVHFNFVDTSIVSDFADGIRASGASALLLGGDIAEAVDVEEWLGFLAERLDLPVYFVLGNHDYYGGRIDPVRKRMAALRTPLCWLPAAGVVSLSSRAALVGHGGWGDARLGDFMKSDVMLSDYFAISDLAECFDYDPTKFRVRKVALASKLRRLGDAAAATLRPALRQAARSYPEVVVLTHVPPFRESCWHRGRISSEDWLPSFTCKAVGDLLLEVGTEFSNTKLTVLCGHTHGSGEAKLLPNLKVTTRGARYGSPEWQLVSVAS